MSALKKPVAALIGVVAMMLAGLFFAVTSAGAYPGGTNAALSVADSTPAAGAGDSVSGTGYQPGETVALEFHSVVSGLGKRYATRWAKMPRSCSTPTVDGTRTTHSNGHTRWRSTGLTGWKR